MKRRRTARLLWLAVPPLGVAAAAVLLVVGAFSAAAPPGARQLVGWAVLAAAGLWLGGRQVRFQLRSRGGGPKLPVSWQAEAGAWLAVATLALVERTGGRASALQPLVYLVGAGFALALPGRLAVPLIAALSGLEVALGAVQGGLVARWPQLLAHASFLALFAALYHALLGSRLLLARRAERDAVARRVAEAEERARELRLIAVAEPSGDLSSGAEARERQVLAAVGELEAVLRGSLEVARAALQPHTAAVFLLSPDGSHVRLREGLSASDALFRGPLASREGAVGAVLAAGRPVRLCGQGPALAYYQGEAPVAAFLGVPLRERMGNAAHEPRTDPAPLPGPHAPVALSDPAWASPAADAPARPPQPSRAPEGEVIGALVVDRQLPFSSDDERVLEALAAEVARALEAERLLTAIRREKEEKHRFFRALEELNRSTSAAQAAQTAILHAQNICKGLDLVAVTVREEAEEQQHRSRPNPARRGRGGKVPVSKRALHRVVAVAGEGTAGLQELTFPDNAGLVSNVVRMGVAMPARAAGGAERQAIFDAATTVRGLQALKVFPLRAGDAVVGTLVCGTRSAKALTAAAERELGLLALQAAEAVVRTKLYEQAERLATTDGLTGLLNRRTLMTQLSARFAEASRYHKALSFLLLDVDHFKKVNDTYGHPAGDAVLRGVAAVASAQARETDLVARYGGEEMALVLPETDAAGAQVIAERLRASLEASEHESEKGPLKVTASIGVATWSPQTPFETVEALLEAADAALYRAKQAGRNRVEFARTLAAA